MPKSILEIVQTDADVLWWFRDPKLDDELNQQGAKDWAAGIAPDADVIVKNGKRIRRWVAAGTAIGPRSRGGVGIMTWADHVLAIKAQWIICYLQPGEAAWKYVLDEFILKNKQGSALQYPEGRSIVAMNLTDAQNAAILTKLPSKAHNSKECLKAFWNPGKRRRSSSGRGGASTRKWWEPEKTTECVLPTKAYANLVRMAYTRVKAYGAKWYR